MADTIRLTFTKLAGKYDKLLIQGNGRELAIDCPKQRIIPHDLIHYAIEKVMGLRGFVRLVTEGRAEGNDRARRGRGAGCRTWARPRHPPVHGVGTVRVRRTSHGEFCIFRADTGRADGERRAGGRLDGRSRRGRNPPSAIEYKM